MPQADGSWTAKVRSADDRAYGRVSHHIWSVPRAPSARFTELPVVEVAGPRADAT
ncbi:hypothetical protein ACWCOW_03340 [Streptomyces sp. NPDC001939]|uniref:hypothetical protein n=1 Tax=Streptomyces sp. NPDC056240 TaxID=3345759 RepID=UPI0035DFD84F